LWFESPEMIVAGDVNALCTVYVDSSHYYLDQILRINQSNQIDTTVSLNFSFDFVSGGTYFDMEYVFASDEYDSLVQSCVSEFPQQSVVNDKVSIGERLCNYVNDGIAMFLSGPDINGTYHDKSENIATIPGTNAPVCTQNI